MGELVPAPGVPQEAKPLGELPAAPRVGLVTDARQGGQREQH